MLSGAVIWFIDTGITSHRDHSSLLVSLNTHCHLVSLESHWKYLCLSFPPSATLILLLSQTLCFFSLSLLPSLLFLFFFPLAVSASISHFLLFQTLFLLPPMSLLFMFISLFVSLVVTRLSSVCACRHQRQSQQVVRHSFTRLRETGDEKRSVGGDNSLQALRYVM